jgi:hypothetical protein
MRATYIWVSRLIALGVVLQAAFAAFGTFQIVRAANDGTAYTEDSGENLGQQLHSVFGTVVLPLLALILLAIPFFARIPGGARLAVVVAGLTVVQVLLGVFSYPVPAIGLLHGINAFALAAAAGFAGRRAGQAPAVAPDSEATPAA